MDLYSSTRLIRLRLSIQFWIFKCLVSALQQTNERHFLMGAL